MSNAQVAKLGRLKRRTNTMRLRGFENRLADVVGSVQSSLFRLVPKGS
jgi:hypothetical protein